MARNLTRLDRIDRQIIHALGVDGRAGFARLASVLDTSEQTIRRRYARLVENGVVRVVALRRPPSGDLGQFLRVHVQPGAAVTLARALARLDSVAWVRIAAAGAEVICGVRTANYEDRDTLILENLPKTGKVTAITSLALLHTFTTPGRPDWSGFPDQLDNKQSASLTPPRSNDGLALDENDQLIIDALRDDARRPTTKIAAQIGLPETTVRRRLDALLLSGELVLDLDVDRAALGYPTSGTLYLTVEPSELHRIGEELLRHDPTLFVAAATGPWNLIAAVTFPNIDKFYAYITESLAALSGVRALETSMNTAYVKDARMQHPAPIEKYHTSPNAADD